MADILIVDDDLRFRRTLHLALHSQGYRVDEAADGKAALESLRTRVPDLVVLDWHMPGLDGIQTCRLVRALCDVPVIMASANRSNSRAVALAAGASDYLTKPFSIDELLTSIQSILKQHELDSERHP